MKDSSNTDVEQWILSFDWLVNEPYMECFDCSRDWMLASDIIIALVQDNIGAKKWSRKLLGVGIMR